VLPIELQEVEPLEDLVGKLGVANSGLGIQTRRDGIFFDHGADPEVLTDIAQKRNRPEVFCPIEVVDKDDFVRAGVVQEATHLITKPLDPLGNGLWIIQRALGGGLWISN